MRLYFRYLSISITVPMNSGSFVALAFVCSFFINYFPVKDIRYSHSFFIDMVVFPFTTTKFMVY